MNVLQITIPFALLMGGLFIAAFIWAVRSDQYEDLDTPPLRILFDRAPGRKNEEK